MNRPIKKIVLFGGSGMVGQNIQNHAKAKGCELLAPTHWNVNLLTAENVWNYLQREHPDMVIHAAGKVGGIQANNADLFGFMQENTQIGMNVIGAARDCNVPYLINLGSSCMYPKTAVSPIPESQLMAGPPEPTNEGYAIAKLYAMKLCEYTSNQLGQLGREYKTLIPCNLYGKFDKFDAFRAHMVPSAIRKVHEAKESADPDPGIEIWGDGTARREFMYAEDLADFIFFAIENWEKVPVVMNVGLGYDFSVLEYYQTVMKVLEGKGHIFFDTRKPAGMQQRYLDVTQQNNLGWKPKTSLEEGIRKTYEFFLETKNKR